MTSSAQRKKGAVLPAISTSGARHRQSLPYTAQDIRPVFAEVP